MAYQLPQTYPFVCPQAKQIGILSERGLKTAETHTILNLLFLPLQCCKPHRISANFRGTSCIRPQLSNQTFQPTALLIPPDIPSTDFIFAYKCVG